MRRPSALIVPLCLLLLFTIPTDAAAQDDESHWGVAVGFVPSWESHDVVKILFDDAERLELSGDEFRIGVARGKAYGGDWSLSYVRKKIDPGSVVVIQDPTPFEFNPGQFFIFGERIVVEDVRLDGLEFQKFVNFATIKRRVQIGMNFGVGFAKIKGTVRRQSVFADFGETGLNPIQSESETIEPANEMLAGGIDYLPLGKIELAVGAIVVPGLKVRVSGGFNMPGVPALGISAVYLFGAD